MIAFMSLYDMLKYPSYSVEYLARKGQRGVSNVSATITRWLFFNVTESPRLRFLCPFLALADPRDVEAQLTELLTELQHLWDTTATVPFSFAFLQDNAVVLRLGSLHVQITVDTEEPHIEGLQPVRLCWYVESGSHK
jgi:hypothetical protein